MDKLFPIKKLRQLVAIALASEQYQPAESARVRAVPDVRTIRYYTTIGLIDGPAEMKGRTALYSLRHVRQLVAIKKLQGEGHSLSEIQQQLEEITAQKLVKLASLPKDLDSLVDQPIAPETEQPVKLAKEPTPKKAAREFWQQVPRTRKLPSEINSIKRVVRIELDENVVLEVQSDNANLNIDRLRDAARKLLEELNQQNP